MSRVVHLVGIGGAGMSAIAWVLQGRGETVTGSDREISVYSEALEDAGVDIHYGHRAENVHDVDLIVASSAVPETNIELQTADERGIPVLRRDVFLPMLTEGKRTIAVAGTHGKTTTTGIIAWVLDQAGLDPTFIAGGMLQNYDRNARAGHGNHFVIEADEYEGAFLGLEPEVAVITNVEHDHPDCFPTPESFRETFATFVDSVTDLLVVSADDQAALNLKPQGCERQTFGFAQDAGWQAVDQQINPAGGMDFVVIREGVTLGLVRTRLPGEHNVKNTLAAIAVADHEGIEFKDSREAIAEFRGIRRRFEILGEIQGITVIDDYAHHPTEIQVTLSAARNRNPGQTIWAIFQPHTYSRVAALLQDFAEAFSDADEVVVTDVFAARENHDPALSGKRIANEINHPSVRHIPDLKDVAQFLEEHVRRDSVVLTLSAGDGNQVGSLLLKNLEKGEVDHG